MSMTSEGLRPKRRREPSKAGTLASIRSNLGARFVQMMQAAGLRVPKGVSMVALMLMRDMASAGGVMAGAKSSCYARTGSVCQPSPGMGLIIKHGYARYVPEVKHFELTPAAYELLASAEAKGLMKKLAEFEALLREAAAREQTTKGEHDA